MTAGGPGGPLIITGAGVLSAGGVGLDALAALDGADGPPAIEVGGMFEVPLPAPTAPVLVDFDVRAHLGRKGTSFYDRCTALAVVACGEALRDGDVTVDDTTRSRIGIVLATTLGSFRSTSDYSLETLVQDKPYQVNPVLFPNTVMNGAAGQAAIRHALRGVNATIAGGRPAFHQALVYGANALRQGYVDTLLIGAVEEFSPHRAWRTRLTEPAAVAGEGAAVFVVQRAGADGFSAGRPLAEVSATATGFGAGGQALPALAGCVRRALAAAALDGREVDLVVTGTPAADPREYDTVADVIGHRPQRWTVQDTLGECDAATGAFGMARILARFRQQARVPVSSGPSGPSGSLPSAGCVLLTACAPDGGVAAVVVRGCR